MSILTIIDPGSGMQPGIVHAFDHAGIEVEVTDDPLAVEQAAAVVLPWTGPLGDALPALEERELTEPLRDLARRQVPVLGVGAGSLLLAATLADGSPGLGLLPGRVVPVPVKDGGGGSPRTLTGWTPLTPTATDPLFDGIVAGAWFYFVAAHVLEAGVPATGDAAHETPPGAPVTIVATGETNHTRFAAVVRAGTVAGVLFEAGKSGDVGLRVLTNFGRSVQAMRQANG
ncbi:MAG: hypothetical protein AB7K09_16680 [Planctomycetota bacterium]